MTPNVVIDPDCRRMIEQMRDKPAQQLTGLSARWDGETVLIGLPSESDNVTLLPARGHTVTPARTARRRSPVFRTADWYGYAILLLLLASGLLSGACLLHAF